MGYAAIVIGAVIFLMDLYFLFISLRFRKTRCEKCKGYLENTIQYKNVWRGGKTGKFYKRFIDYTYVYRVNGKQYYISSGNPGEKENPARVVDVIYQKNHPEFAYIKGLTFPDQPVVAAILCPLWIFLTICGFLLI
ncbi:MAG: hypothetical protein IJA86_05635 [Clostridia bacterium]|nr:hypothetical protein [Clostridia bacterium]